MSLSEEIKQYYFDRISELPKNKQFHFCSRVAAWSQDKRAKTGLAGLKSYLLPSEDSSEISDTLKSIIDGPIKAKPYAYELRHPYFKKYPDLYGIHNAFFRIRHLEEIYGLDARAEFLNLVNRDELDRLYESLTQDTEAIRFLSRFAVDYIYLYEILFNKQPRFDPEIIYGLSRDYSLANPQQANLFIYLFTHCLIADSNFYVRPVPLDRLPVYKKMIGELEEFVNNHDDIKLDSLFEIRVASRICGQDSTLSDIIEKKAKNLLSVDGTYITDPLNSAHPKLNSFSGSEHRNVLYIMGCSDYSPSS